jgi:hypothetical protein
VWPFFKVSANLWVICNPQRYFPTRMWVPCLVERCCYVDMMCKEERRPVQLDVEIRTDLLPCLKGALVLLNTKNNWAFGLFVSRVGWTVDMFRCSGRCRASPWEALPSDSSLPLSILVLWIMFSVAPLTILSTSIVLHLAWHDYNLLTSPYVLFRSNSMSLQSLKSIKHGGNISSLSFLS